jgi:2,3-bisphosphoglycerate-independent phosphoglycerate mutase
MIPKCLFPCSLYEPDTCALQDSADTDHPAPIYARTHTLDAVPFAIISSEKKKPKRISVYDEQSGFEGGIYLTRARWLMDYFIKL